MLNFELISFLMVLETSVLPATTIGAILLILTVIETSVLHITTIGAITPF